MYINKIDELIDQTLDNFYLSFKKDSLLNNLKKEYNFVKYQNQINELIFDLNEIELQIKKNYTNSINIISDFILNHSISNH